MLRIALFLGTNLAIVMLISVTFRLLGIEGLLMAVDKGVPRLDAVAHHLALIARQGEEHEVLGGVSEQVADLADELYSASDRDKLRDWGNQIDTTGKAH